MFFLLCSNERVDDARKNDTSWPWLMQLINPMNYHHIIWICTIQSDISVKNMVIGSSLKKTDSKKF